MMEMKMGLIVQKYGGTSVGSAKRIKAVADRVIQTYKQGADVVVVVSAMAGETDRLVSLSRDMAKDPVEREMDVLLSSGEQVSIALLAMAICGKGYEARSFLGRQVKIKTDSAFSRARINSIDPGPLTECLEQRNIAVIAGFQGIDDEGNQTTLGRGGSDTTAVAISAALKADSCEIYTDVDGVYTTDPGIVKDARKLDKISYDEMLEMASLGAKILHTRAVVFAKKYNVPLHVRSSFNNTTGTMVIKEEKEMEKVSVTGITYNRDEAKITILGVPDKPGIMESLFCPVSDAGINIDMIVKASSTEGFTDFSFTVPKSDFKTALLIVQGVADKVEAVGVESDPDVAKVSIIGVGMRAHVGIATKLFTTFARENINTQIVSTSEIKISVLVEEKYLEQAVKALHGAFGLENADLSEECLVCDGG